MQAASLVLVTTPAESLAMGLRTALRPLRFVGVPVQVRSLWQPALPCLQQRAACLQGSSEAPAEQPQGPCLRMVCWQAWPARPSSCLPSRQRHPPRRGAQEITLTLLLSLRCLGLVFEDLRNLVLGLAVRGVDWSQTNALLVGAALSKRRRAACTAGRDTSDQQAPNCACLQVASRLASRLLQKLVQRSENMAVAMQARGFSSVREHSIHPVEQPGSLQALLAAYASLVVGGLACWQLSAL